MALARRVAYSSAVLLAAWALFDCSSSSSGGDGAAPGPAPNPNGLTNGAGCTQGSDCKTGVCESSVCVAPPNAPPSHDDGRKNLDETDIDCGGASGAPACATGKTCNVGGDCASATCLQGICRDPSATDGVKDGDETDVDCGGTNAPPCTPGQGCLAPTDCDSKVCGADGKCAAPTSTDGVQNGDESDVDCGGTTTNAPKCVVGKMCKAHADCASDGCDYNGKCIAIRSCAPHHGGDTCGPGETDATHESCCTTINLPSAPGGAVKLDKYNITAGRFRQFVERTNGDVRGWMTANAPSWWNAAWTQYLPTTLDNGGSNPDFTGVYQEVGPYVHGTAGGGNEGCYVKGPGARTFRLPDAVNTRMSDPQYYTQDVSDEKALNCVPAYLVAAFCAWDGGKLPGVAVMNYAWGSATYPWGASPGPAGWSTAYDSDATGLPFTPANGDVKRANWLYNYWSPATRIQTDYAIYIAAPGRFPTGNGPYGHSDLGGSVMQFEAISGSSAYWSKAGSWQGHSIPFGDGTVTFPASNKYWAAGGRCAR
jgi:hypothetical protein